MGHQHLSNSGLGWPGLKTENPVNEVIKIKNNNSVAIESIEIFTIRGQLVFSTSENFDEINVSQLETAMYLLKIRTKIGQKTVKFIKE